MKSFIVTLVTSAFLAACHGQQAPDSPPRASVAGGAGRTASASASMGRTQGGERAVYSLVEKLLSDPRIVKKPWIEMQRAFPDGCQQTPDSTEIICPPMDGVTRISAMASGHGIVELTMTSPVTCEELRAVVVNRFGPSKTTSTNGCSGDWDLSEYMATGYLRVSKGKKDPAKLSLQFGVVQGP